MSRAHIVLLAAILGGCGSGATALGASDLPPSEICDNGRDDDRDGRVDCDDRDCRDTTACDRCGDGVARLDEACDRNDLRGQTCAGLGFPLGQLACTTVCTLDPTPCTFPPESCSVPGDEDHDGAADCADPDCADRVQCRTLEVSAPDSAFVTARVYMTLRLRDGRGLPAAGVSIAVAAPSGAVAPSRVRTGDDGSAQLQVRLGPLPGPQTFRFQQQRDVDTPVTLEANLPAPGTIVDVLGTGEDGADAGGPALDAHVGEIVDLAVSPGELYVAERCRVIAISTDGVLSRVVGTGTCGESGPLLQGDSLITAAGIAWGSGRLYLTTGARIFAVNAGTGEGELLAGDGTLDPDAAEGRPATEVRLVRPGRPRVGAGSLWFADEGLRRALRVDLADGTIHAVLHGVQGSDEVRRCADPVAMLEPRFVLPDAAGTPFVSGRLCGTETNDPGGAALHEGAVRVGASGLELAVGWYGPGLQPDGWPGFKTNVATTPTGGFDAAGNWITVSGSRILRLDAVHQGATAIAGQATQGDAGDLVPATQALLSSPAAVVLDAAGDAWIADTGNHRVRRIVGAGESQRRAVQLVPESSSLPMATAGEVAVLLRDETGRALRARRVRVDAEGLHVEQPPSTTVAGEIVIPVRTGVRPGRIPLHLHLPGLHGDESDSDVAVDIEDEAAGTIFTALDRGELPSGPVVSSLAVASDGTIYVGILCWVYRLSPAGELEQIAGTSDCAGDPFDGPALQMPFPTAHLALDDARGVLYGGGWGGLSLVAALDLAAGTVRTVGSWTSALAVADGGMLTGATQQAIDGIDPGTGAVQLIAGLTPTSCPSAGPQWLDPEVLAFHGGRYLAGGGTCADEAVIGWSADAGWTVPLHGTPTGDPADGAAVGEALLTRVTGLAVDDEGRLLVVDQRTRLLQVEDGKVHVLMTNGLPQLDRVPYAGSGLIAVTILAHAGGHIWLLDHDSVRVIW